MRGPDTPGGYFLSDPSARADLAPFDQVHSEYYLKIPGGG